MQWKNDPKIYQELQKMKAVEGKKTGKSKITYQGHIITKSVAGN